MGYLLAFLFNLRIAPHNEYRYLMPDRTYAVNVILLFAGGVVAAAVAHQIRRHLIAAAQAEAETRRKLDRIEYSMRTARSIQMGLLPKNPPVVIGYDVAGFSEPADQTGGDYYDWIELSDQRVLFTIADAAGHGLGPSLLISSCRAYFRALAKHDDPLERMMTQVDALFSADTQDGRFVTAAVACSIRFSIDCRFIPPATRCFCMLLRKPTSKSSMPTSRPWASRLRQRRCQRALARFHSRPATLCGARDRWFF